MKSGPEAAEISDTPAMGGFDPALTPENRDPHTDDEIPRMALCLRNSRLFIFFFIFFSIRWLYAGLAAFDSLMQPVYPLNSEGLSSQQNLAHDYG
jgi:hypothetical protein